MNKHQETFHRHAHILKQIEFHAGIRATSPERDQRRLPEQFRPFSGSIDWSSMDKVEELTMEFSRSDGASSGLAVPFVFSLWTLTALLHSWVLDADGMLQRNGLIKTEDAQKIRAWLIRLEEIGGELLKAHPDSLLWNKE